MFEVDYVDELSGAHRDTTGDLSHLQGVSGAIRAVLELPTLEHGDQA